MGQGPCAASAVASPGARLLVVAPHPDDETLATGTLIQQVLAAGGAVHVLLLSDGDNNPWPQRWIERGMAIGMPARQRWGRRRRGEAVQALRCLGLADDALTAFGWPDQGLTALLQRDAAAPSAAVGAVLESFRPDFVAMPDLSDSHPDHGAAHVLMRLAMLARACPAQVLLYRVHGGAVEGDLVLQLPVDGPEQGRKLQALASHASQMALSSGRMRGKAASPERFAALPAPRQGDVLPWRPPRFAWPWLELTVAGSGVWSWSRAPWERAGDDGFRLLRPANAPPGPCFVKLASRLPSPWIFDRWGWCELG